jgi:phosphoribosylglycinamide formyltransferase-1
MRVLGAGFVQRFEGRLINIHPSLLPAFPGLNTHQRALEAGVCLHGATVHFVNEALDGGPIIAQAFVPVLRTDNEVSLAERVLSEEHRLLPQVVADFCRGLISLDPQGKLECSPEATRLLFPLTSGAA